MNMNPRYATHRLLDSRRDARRPTGRDESGRTFSASLEEAHKELVRLLRDVRLGADRASTGAHQDHGITDLLVRAVRCALNQYSLQAELGNLALADELTGLYNRRGFMALAEGHVKLARRSGRGIWLFIMDVDGLKQINDTLGHVEGDRALKRAAAVLGKTFRESDLLARLGGDEFAALAIDASGYGRATITTRLREQLRRANAQESRYTLALSSGAIQVDGSSEASIEQLIVRADQAMYKQKDRRKTAGGRHWRGPTPPGRQPTTASPRLVSFPARHN